MTIKIYYYLIFWKKEIENLNKKRKNFCALFSNKKLFTACALAIYSTQFLYKKVENPSD